jgi:hypothetical protein
MSNNTTTIPKKSTVPTEPTTKKKVPYCPNLIELQELYSGYAPSFIEENYKYIKKEYPVPAPLKQPRCLTQYQFMKFIQFWGLPQGFSQSDYPLLKDVTLFEVKSS